MQRILHDSDSLNSCLTYHLCLCLCLLYPCLFLFPCSWFCLPVVASMSPPILPSLFPPFQPRHRPLHIFRSHKPRWSGKCPPFGTWEESTIDVGVPRPTTRRRYAIIRGRRKKGFTFVIRCAVHTRSRESKRKRRGYMYSTPRRDSGNSVIFRGCGLHALFVTHRPPCVFLVVTPQTPSSLPRGESMVSRDQLIFPPVHALHSSLVDRIMTNTHSLPHDVDCRLSITNEVRQSQSNTLTHVLKLSNNGNQVCSRRKTEY